MTHNELIVAEVKARQAGDTALADRLRAIRWQKAMGLIVNSENVKKIGSETMTLARNTEAYNLLQGLIQSYGANVVRDTILHIVGIGDLTDPTHPRHLEGGLRPYTVDERLHGYRGEVCPGCGAEPRAGRGHIQGCPNA